MKAPPNLLMEVTVLNLRQVFKKHLRSLDLNQIAPLTRRQQEAEWSKFWNGLKPQVFIKGRL